MFIREQTWGVLTGLIAQMKQKKVCTYVDALKISLAQKLVQCVPALIMRFHHINVEHARRNFMDRQTNRKKEDGNILMQSADAFTIMPSSSADNHVQCIHRYSYIKGQALWKSTLHKLHSFLICPRFRAQASAEYPSSQGTLELPANLMCFSYFLMRDTSRFVFNLLLDWFRVLLLSIFFLLSNIILGLFEF